jgi:hypothetical protein
MIHQAIDEMSEEEAERLLEVYTERCKSEAQGLALRHAFAEVYRAREQAQ